MVSHLQPQAHDYQKLLGTQLHQARVRVENGYRHNYELPVAPSTDL